MRKLESLSFRFDGEHLWALDQTLLPQKSEWIKCTNPDDMVTCIRQLKIRGAPLIGVAAAMCLARLAENGVTEALYREAAKKLVAARPTAVNLANAIDRMTQFRVGAMNVRELVETAENIFYEDQKLCEQIAKNGVDLISDGDHVLTYCNTGGLATAGVGTALGVLRRAHEQNKKFHVYACETRPLLQGGRLTAWELSQLGIPHTLICDNMAGLLMAQGKIQKIIVGCDRIALNGDFANKVGTYSVAVLAHHHKIPFYVAGPHTTIDWKCENGSQIVIEQRDAAEVRGVAGAFGSVTWAPQDATVLNPAFDVTPAKMVSGWVLDKGVLDQKSITGGGLVACLP
jgi:methylthioribose-1-phosphate isomerase